MRKIKRVGERYKKKKLGAPYTLTASYCNIIKQKDIIYMP
jgi:hypothetical protein